MAYVLRDGQRVAQAVAHDFDLMAAVFRVVFGLNLLVSSGTRTALEQETIFRQRYVIAANVNGRRVYDTRWWKGVLWYRISSAGTVAVPGTSNHEENGPIGPRALDVRDSGANAGVTVRNTVRSNWLRDNCRRFNFVNDGLDFGEPWHIRWLGANPHGPTPGSSSNLSSKEDDQMYSIRVNKHHQYGIAKQFITHYGDGAQANITRQVTSGTDELHELTTATFTALLDGLGIPRNVMDNEGKVLNPQDGKFSWNGTWSREREILAALGKK